MVSRMIKFLLFHYLGVCRRYHFYRNLWLSAGYFTTLCVDDYCAARENCVWATTANKITDLQATQKMFSDIFAFRQRMMETLIVTFGRKTSY